MRCNPRYLLLHLHTHTGSIGCWRTIEMIVEARQYISTALLSDISGRCCCCSVRRINNLSSLDDVDTSCQFQLKFYPSVHLCMNDKKWFFKYRKKNRRYKIHTINGIERWEEMLILMLYEWANFVYNSTQKCNRCLHYNAPAVSRAYRKFHDKIKIWRNSVNHHQSHPKFNNYNDIGAMNS